MKSLSKILGLLVILFITVFSANAQQNLLPGAQHTYNVTDNATGFVYNWSITGGVSGTDWTLSSATGASTNVTWTTPGTHTLTMTEDNNGCITTNTITVVVAGASIYFTDATGGADCSLSDQVLALTYTGTLYPVDVVYSINGGANQTKTIANAADLSLTIPAASRPEPVDGNDDSVTIAIVSATGPSNGTVTVGANNTLTNTVYMRPLANPIVY